MDVLLVNPPTLYRGKTLDDLNRVDLNIPSMPYYQKLLAFDTTKRDGFSTLPGEHLGLQSLQANLEANNYNASIVNACVELHSSLPQTLRCIQEYDSKLIGFTGPVDVFSENLWLARKLRETGYTGHITLGHDFATLNHQTILNLYPEFDSIVRGEGEATISELATALEKGCSLQGIHGLSFRDDTKIVINPPRPAISDLDELPRVTRHDLPTVLQLRMSAGIFTKRGCPYRCSFCTTGIVPLSEDFKGPDRWRKRSPKQVVNEIEFLVDEYDLHSITIVDDLYIAKGTRGSQHALEIAEELLSRKVDIKYMIDCRVDSMTYDTFKVLKKSGLRKVFVGVESSSEAALSSFNKGYKPEIIRDKLHILEELDIEFILGYIMFSPLDTLEGLEQSYQLLLDLNRRDFGLFLQAVRIYPGTPLHHNLAQMDLLSGEFPNFSSCYLNPYVRRLRKMMAEFGRLAVPIMRIAQQKGEQFATQTREQLYVLASDTLRELIDSAKMCDDQNLEKIYGQMIQQLTQFTSVEQ